LLSEKADKISWGLFALHLILTIPTVIFLKFPSVLLDIQQTGQDELIKAIFFRLKLIPVAWILFITGQVFILIYYLRAIKTKHNAA
jgi:hypothetical protein